MLVNKTILVNGRRTSARLEPEFWEALDIISKETKQPKSKILDAADKNKRPGESLSSALRTFCMRHFTMNLVSGIINAKP